MVPTNSMPRYMHGRGTEAHTASLKSRYLKWVSRNEPHLASPHRVRAAFLSIKLRTLRCWAPPRIWNPLMHLPWDHTPTTCLHLHFPVLHLHMSLHLLKYAREERMKNGPSAAWCSVEKCMTGPDFSTLLIWEVSKGNQTLQHGSPWSDLIICIREWRSHPAEVRKRGSTCQFLDNVKTARVESLLCSANHTNIIPTVMKSCRPKSHDRR